MTTSMTGTGMETARSSIQNQLPSLPRPISCLQLLVDVALALMERSVLQKPPATSQNELSPLQRIYYVHLCLLYDHLSSPQGVAEARNIRYAIGPIGFIRGVGFFMPDDGVKSRRRGE